MKKMIKKIQDYLKGKIGFVIKQVVVVSIAIIVASIVIVLSGFDFAAVARGMGNAITGDFAGTLRWFTPLLFTGLACAVAFKAGIWNMGVDGQLYMGAIAATAIGVKLSFLPAWILLPSVIIGGALAGAVWASIAGYLKVYCGANEVVTTILMNYLAFNFSDYLVMGPLKGSGMYSAAQSSDVLPESVWLPKIITNSSVSSAIFIALILAILLHVLMSKTPFGYEMKMIGTNRSFATYGGIKVKGSFIKIFMLSGAIAGLAGVFEIIGIHHRFPFRFTDNLGFEGIVIAILANNSPLGVIISALLFAVLRNGSYNIERMSSVPRTLVLVIQAIIIIFAGANFVFSKKKTDKDSFFSSWKNKIFKNKNKKARDLNG